MSHHAHNRATTSVVVISSLIFISMVVISRSMASALKARPASLVRKYHQMSAFNLGGSGMYLNPLRGKTSSASHFMGYHHVFPCHSLGMKNTKRNHQLFALGPVQKSMTCMHSTTYSDQISSALLNTPDESSNNEIKLESDLSNLCEIVTSAYEVGETDGVQDAFASQYILPLLCMKYSSQSSSEATTKVQKLREGRAVDMTDFNFDSADFEEVANELVSTAVEAATSESNMLDRGALAAILNAIFASCCGKNHNSEYCMNFPNVALFTLQIMDDMFSEDESTMVTPDLVSFALVYCTLLQSPFMEDEALAILERAKKLAKKTAGSQRRKALAAERRRRPRQNADIDEDDFVEDIEELEQRLQSFYGSDIKILYNSKDIIVVSKPAGMVCYHTKKTTAGKITTSRKKKKKSSESSAESEAAKIMDISLEDGLLDGLVPLSTLNPSARGIVHRLDRGTSGCIALAKTDDAHLRLVASFFLRRVKKKYSALIPASAVNGFDGTVAVKEMAVGSEGVVIIPVDGRPAVSKYKVLSVHGQERPNSQQSSNSQAVLLQVETLTGRKHQVRVHCANGLGRPIFLDPLYSDFAPLQSTKSDQKSKKKNQKRYQSYTSKSKSTRTVNESATMLPEAVRNLLEREKNNPYERFFLHAAYLSIPEFGIEAESPLPEWWWRTLDDFCGAR
mmetsp:Transcript_29887/g.62620  ORF Transcript_29887/g.62620 Transcript_29887/m.62620 type:complete len:679 (-) Transcript_29887:221-2257(-)